MIEGDEGEGAESPEDEGVGEAGQGAFADDFRLADDLPEEVPDAAAESEVEAGILFRFEDAVENEAETSPEERGGSDDERCEEQFFPKREVLRLCQCEIERKHRRTFPTIHDRGPGRQCSYFPAQK